MSGFELQLDSSAFEPVIRLAAARTLAAPEVDRAQLDGQPALGAAEAAELLGLRPHQLRDERRHSRVKASHGPGKMLYTASNLLEYLASRPYTPSASGSIEAPTQDGSESNQKTQGINDLQRMKCPW